MTEGPDERDSSIQAGVHRVELTVMAHNQRAVKLYELYMAAILARRDPK